MHLFRESDHLMCNIKNLNTSWLIHHNRPLTDDVAEVSAVQPTDIEIQS